MTELPSSDHQCNCGARYGTSHAHDCPAVPTSNHQLSFQHRVSDWMMETFSMEVTRDTTERNHRFLEEALELVQSLNCTREEAHMLVDYVFGRPIGAPEQEVGGVTVTLAALCNAADMDVIECGERELSRCWLNIDRIRAKQAGKPRNSPLPGSSRDETSSAKHQGWCASRNPDPCNCGIATKGASAWCPHYDLPIMNQPGCPDCAYEKTTGQWDPRAAAVKQDPHCATCKCFSEEPACKHSWLELRPQDGPGVECDKCGEKRPEKASAHIVGDRCSNWPCQLLRFHDGPCSTAENGT